jgi:hypothetical protein
MNSFGEVLAHFKKTEDAENLVTLIEDEELRNAIVAWKSVAIQYVTPVRNCPFDDESRQWSWLWEQVNFDRSCFGVVAGIRAQDVGMILTRLTGLRLIYPDGTINTLARQYLTSIIMSKLRQIEPRGKRVPVPSHPDKKE